MMFTFFQLLSSTDSHDFMMDSGLVTTSAGSFRTLGQLWLALLHPEYFPSSYNKVSGFFFFSTGAI